MDAAHILGKHACLVVAIDGHWRMYNPLTLYTKKPDVAEQAAIAPALKDLSFTTIYSDFRTATRFFTKGRVDKTML